jgi:Uma2 family endonuclease
MASDTRVHRFSTAEYERMVNSGVLEELRVELLDGLLIDMPVQGEPHVQVTHPLIR